MSNPTDQNGFTTAMITTTIMITVGTSFANLYCRPVNVLRPSAKARRFAPSHM